MSAPPNQARTVWVAFGIVALILGIAWQGIPVFLFVMGAPVDVGKAFLLSLGADVLLAAVFTAGMLVARKRRDGTLRALPPAIATVILLPLAVIANTLVLAWSPQ